ncbi:MAG: reverse transcriptase/maturase family protein [Candidatus Nomurabacteria bacterium]|jgi:retron-type reverse transcriptase|nr:reverse transcriptase/maturase family protein [Candidatus Nomurabacteria bacterium]
MKSLPKNTLEIAATYVKFYEAYERAKADKTNKPEVIRFERHLAANLFKLMGEAKAGTYTPSPYRTIIVHEPKTRTIHALPFRDRVLHQWYVGEFILPFFVPRFVTTSYACIIKRGTHGALRQTKQYLRQAIREYQDPYILKMDIAGYFYHIDKDILYHLVTKKIKDPRLKALTHTIIHDGFDGIEGIPIGNYTSQYFANIYLNELDQHIKRVMKIKFYLRYMDDFILIVEGKAAAKQAFTDIKNFVGEKLKLDLNRKSHYYPARYGIDFVGYITFKDFVLLRKRAKRKAKLIVKHFKKSKDEDDFYLRANSWLGHAAHADTFKLRSKYFAEYKNILDAHIWEAGKTPKTPKKPRRNRPTTTPPSSNPTTPSLSTY